jgi:pimeloyl-ACP methyl ester carboxylesterase
MHFPYGYRSFHSDIAFNFELNRLLSVIPENELWEIAPRIATLGDWKNVMLNAAQTAEQKAPNLIAAYYYRSAEFFMHSQDPDKILAYDKFIDLFYQCPECSSYQRQQVPFDGSQLPAIIIPANGVEKDIILFHGGFDSVMEEFIESAQYFAESGYRVVLFEGPGQGAALRKSKLTMKPEWERPVQAVLDHFQIESCTILGISLGGYLAPRAAAFEPRICRVIVSDVLDDFFDCYAARIGETMATKLRQLLDSQQRAIVNDSIARLATGKPEMEWSIAHGMDVCGGQDAFDFLRWLQSMNTASFSSRITQDFLLLAGANDHIVPLHQFYRQAQNLSKVRSLTGRIFTAQEQAGNHCQVGNLALALGFILAWLDFQITSKTS